MEGDNSLRLSVITRRRILILIVACVLLLLPLVVPSEYIRHVLVLIVYYAFLSTSWNLVGGFGGMLSLGHSAFLGLSAYLTYYLFTLYGITPWVGMIIAGLAATFCGALIGYPCFKFGLRGIFFVLVTIAFVEILHDLFVYLREVTGGALGLFLPYVGNNPLVFQFDAKIWYYYVALGFWFVSIYITYKFKGFRYRLLAIREDEDAAAALGIKVGKIKLYAFMVSCFLTGIGGAFWLQYYRYISPIAVLSSGLSLEIVLIAIFGGTDHVLGPTIGSVILKPIAEVLRIYLGGTYAGIHLLFYGIFMIVILMWAPGGICGFIKKYSKYFSGEEE